MPKSPAGQLSLDSLFDTTAISSGFTLGRERIARPVFDDEEDEAPAGPPAVAFRPPARNWRLDGHRLLAPNWKGRAADNLAAIRLLQDLEREDRAATTEEQERLARFTAFGGGDLSQSMFRRAGEDFRGGWEDLGRELEQLVNQEEIAGLARATQYAHYTPEFMVRAMWDALIRMGFSGGNVLEPGCGTGLFLAMLPERAAGKVALTGIEADPITARIAAKLFPEAWIRAEDFTKARLTERYDVVIGNPPFSDRTVRADDAAGKLHLSLHDYFIARSIERLKPGGVAAFVTSRWTMDKFVATAREHIATMADLIGAVRMPQGAMAADAGTEVVVDVLLFQRRQPGAQDHGAAWDTIVEVAPDTDGEGTLHANRYFAEHPEMVLGEHAWTTSQYGPVYTCRPRPGLDLAETLGRALAVLAEGRRLPVPDLPAADRHKTPRIVVAALRVQGLPQLDLDATHLARSGAGAVQLATALTARGALGPVKGASLQIAGQVNGGGRSLEPGDARLRHAWYSCLSLAWACGGDRCARAGLPGRRPAPADRRAARLARGGRSARRGPCRPGRSGEGPSSSRRSSPSTAQAGATLPDGWSCAGLPCRTPQPSRACARSPPMGPSASPRAEPRGRLTLALAPHATPLGVLAFSARTADGSGEAVFDTGRLSFAAKGLQPGDIVPAGRSCAARGSGRCGPDRPRRLDPGGRRLLRRGPHVGLQLQESGRQDRRPARRHPSGLALAPAQRAGPDPGRRPAGDPGASGRPARRLHPGRRPTSTCRAPPRPWPAAAPAWTPCACRSSPARPSPACCGSGTWTWTS